MVWSSSTTRHVSWLRSMLTRWPDGLNASNPFLPDPLASLPDASPSRFRIICSFSDAIRSIEPDAALQHSSKAEGNYAAIEDVFVEPGRLQQILARKRPLRRMEEGQQQGVLAFAQGYRPFLRIDEAPVVTIKPPSAELVSALLDIVGAHRPSVLPAPQHGAIPGIQFADTERLGQAVVGTEFESDHTVNFSAGTTRQNNDWHVRTGTNFPEQIEPIALAQLGNDRTWVLAS